MNTELLLFLLFVALIVCLAYLWDLGDERWGE